MTRAGGVPEGFIPPPPILPRDFLERIAADLRGLSGLVDDLQAELDKQLVPEVGRIMVDHADGVGVGQSCGSTDIYFAGRRHHEAQRQTVKSLRSYVESSQVLVDSLKVAAAQYGDVDAAAGAQVGGVEPAPGTDLKPGVNPSVEKADKALDESVERAEMQDRYEDAYSSRGVNQ